MHIQVLILLSIISLSYLNLINHLSAVGSVWRHHFLPQHIIKRVEVAVICMYAGVVG